VINLEQLGKRICIIGCSNSGKSTLADSLSKKLNVSAYHLDQYAHHSDSKWKRQPDEVLIEAHDRIMTQESWIIDGNYSVCMPTRLDNATSVIWLDPNVFSSVWRYLFRCIKNKADRPGRLAGAQNEFSFWLIKWIIFNYPKNRHKYEKLFKDRSNLLVLHIKSMTDLKKYYKFWGI